MRVVVFLASVFFMLFGNVNSLAGVGLSSSNSEAATLNKIGLDKVSGKNSSLPEKYKILICEDVEDDDGNDLSGKYRSVIGFHSISSYQSFLNLRRNSAKFPFFWPHASHRYILQRNLRI